MRGEIDNTDQGRVTGKLWLLGREEPVTLDLNGDAWADVAGARLTFVNPKPKAQALNEGFQWQQRGQVGDITASRKCKSFEVSDDEFTRAYEEGRVKELPVVWKNTLYLEWYGDFNGRVVVESSDFEITLSEKQWELDQDEHNAQLLLNLQAMRDYLGAMINRREPNEDEDKWPNEMTEEEWEESLKESDRLTDAAMEAQEKFADDPDGNEKEAFVMGWDHMLAGGEGEDALEQSEEDRAWIEEMNRITAEALAEDTADAWKETDDDEDGEDEDLSGTIFAQHPLQKRASDYAMEAMDVLKELGINEERGEDRNHPADRYISNLFQIMGKLAGVLNGTGDMPNGMVLATLKRCLNWANEALSALADLGALHPEANVQTAFEKLRAELLALREGMTDERRARQQGGE